jgi:hypothetical protein
VPELLVYLRQLIPELGNLVTPKAQLSKGRFQALALLCAGLSRRPEAEAHHLLLDERLASELPESLAPVRA